MKTNSLILGLSMIALAFGTNANALSLDEMLTVTKLAIEDLSKTKPEHAPHIYGYKAWKSDEQVKVKVYVKHDEMTMDFSYLCEKHDEGLECHAQ